MVQKVNGPALRAIRELRGMSCASLARAAGVDISFLARIERGEKTGINVAAFNRIVETLNLADPRAIQAGVIQATVASIEPKATDRLRCTCKTSTTPAA